MKPAAALLLMWLLAVATIAVVAWYGIIGEALRAWGV